MSVTVTVKRGAGVRPGKTVTDSLLSGSMAAATARANAELDAAGSQREQIALEIDPQAGLQVNSLAEIVEISGQRWRGLIDGLTMELRAESDDTGRMTISRTMQITIEREA